MIPLVLLIRWKWLDPIDCNDPTDHIGFDRSYWSYSIGSILLIPLIIWNHDLVETALILLIQWSCRSCSDPIEPNDPIGLYGSYWCHWIGSMLLIPSYEPMILWRLHWSHWSYRSYWIGSILLILMIPLDWVDPTDPIEFDRSYWSHWSYEPMILLRLRWSYWSYWIGSILLILLIQLDWNDPTDRVEFGSILLIPLIISYWSDCTLGDPLGPKGPEP